jgi:hypothetical protein
MNIRLSRRLMDSGSPPPALVRGGEGNGSEEVLVAIKVLRHAGASVHAQKPAAESHDRGLQNGGLGRASAAANGGCAKPRVV